MINFIDKEKAINRINCLANDSEPFIFLIDFDQKNAIVLPLKEVSSNEILFEIGNIENYKNRKTSQLNKDFLFKKKPVTYHKFKTAFDQVIQNIQYGNSFLTNLTFETPIDTDLSLEEIFKRSNARYKIYLQDQFVCFSPEIFIKIEGNEISSYPMKGTIDASIENAEEVILNDKKELAEHVTIVDLIRNDLSIVADQVHVPSFRYTELIRNNQSNLIQVSSKISGLIKEEFKDRLGDLIFKLLPAGSISGAPKPQTIEMINQIEAHRRGFYTGICGVYDGQNLNSGVMIRYINKREGKLYFKSGGGITHFSDPKKEYQEYIDKIYLPI